MRATLVVLSCFMCTVVAQDYNCEDQSWSQPSQSTANCFENGEYPSYGNWFCDWKQNSGTYHKFFKCDQFASSPAFYSSYLQRMPGVAHSMIQHTADFLNACTYGDGLDATSWGDIPYMCPDPQSSFYNKIGYGGSTISSMYQQTCQEVQSIFCNTVFPAGFGQYSSQTYTTPSQTYTTTPNTSSMDMLPHFLAHYDYNSGRMYNNPSGHKYNDLTSSYLDQFVSKVHDCQKDFWSSMIKLDCSVTRAMLNALGYPQHDWRWSTNYRSNYDRYHARSLKENCRLIADHIYGGFLGLIHKSAEYVAPSDRGCYESSFLTTKMPTKPFGIHGNGYGKNGGRSDGNDGNDGFSEWAIIVMSLLGVITFLGFCALLFFLIYKLCTHKSVSPGNPAQPPSSRYQSEAGGGHLVVGIAPPSGMAAQAPPTPPPAYDNLEPKKEKIFLE